MEQVVLGKIVAPHGVRGDLRIMPLTSNLQLFMEMGYLLLPDGKRLTVNLIGLPVFDEDGKQIGTFKDVLPTGSRDVYVIAPPEGKDILVANIPENIREIDLPGKRIVVRLPEWDDEDIR